MIEREIDTRKQFNYKIIFVFFVGDLSIKVVPRRKLNPALPIYNKLQKGFKKYYLALSRERMTDKEILKKLILFKAVKPLKKWERMGYKRSIDFIGGKLKA